MKIIKHIILIILVSLSVYVHANTTRDIGNEPELNIKLISKWIIFYTNVERLKNGKDPIQYDIDIEKAAQWQAEYCAKTRDLAHVINVNGMKAPKDRIEHFGSRCGNCGENLTVKFITNTEGISYYIKKDDKGTYFDFGNFTVYYRNEQQMGYSMVDSWMKSPNHRKNILHTGFLWIGGGAAKGIYNNNKSYYGCQVFNGYGGLPREFIKAKYELSGMKIRKNSKDSKDIFYISYNGEMKPGIIEVNDDNELISHPFENNKDELVFVKKARTRGILFAALYDKNTDILYPVILLK